MDLWEIESAFPRVPTNSNSAPNGAPSYAEMAKESEGQSCSLEQLPTPGRRGDFPSIKVPIEAHKRGLNRNRYNLVCRLDLQKILIVKARAQAIDFWKLKRFCRLIPVGKGYIRIFLGNEEDRNKIWSAGPWVIGKQLLRLSPWSPFFDPEMQKNSDAFVWVKFLGLGVKFWEVKTLMSLGRTLVPVPKKIMVDVDEGDFWQRVEHESTLKFCSHCKIIGYTLGNLWCLWQIGLQDPLLVTGSPQQITITYDGILISTIHGMVTTSARRVLWVDMANIAALYLLWLAIGDFNCIRNWDEWSGVKEAANLSANSMSNNCFDLAIVVALGIPIKARPLPHVQSCTWALPWFQEVMINMGAVAMGSPGIAGTGVVTRNHCGEVIGVLSHGVGIKTLFYSECEAVIGALFWVAQRSWKNIWIEANFQSTITSFARNQASWPHRARWNRIKNSFETLRFTHCWKEANFSVIQVAKRSRYLSADCKEYTLLEIGISLGNLGFTDNIVSIL
ncbi:hypothetical protein GIB67_014161 [Kingdonia uniflora]|uniref:RNase H type-1 domain-containing protein n=1 Tax=Kingdonia uniflora TaxID=39325 RepID=A0A7J7ND47_9MAGN|nr:hypothetical protein GIB67_014161 [Kingdonia uniflora]